jgi:hypothetical protein
MSGEQAWARYWAVLGRGSCPALTNAPMDGDGFLPRAKRGLVEGMRLLDALPPTHEVWENTNGRLTHGRLSEFNKLRLERNPRDGQALWSKIALDHHRASGYFNSEEWRQLGRTCRLDVRWPVHQAYYVAAYQGEYASWRSCLSRDLAQFLREEGLTDVAEPALVALASEVKAPPLEWWWAVRPSDWAVRVLHGLQEPGLWEGIREVDALSDGFREAAAEFLQAPPESFRPEQARQAAREGWESASPRDPWSGGQEVLLHEAIIKPEGENAFDPEERRLVMLFGGRALGRLLALGHNGVLDEDAFSIGVEYLRNCLRGGLGQLT